jgi:hypothetical protein
VRGRQIEIASLNAVATPILMFGCPVFVHAIFHASPKDHIVTAYRGLMPQQNARPILRRRLYWLPLHLKPILISFKGMPFIGRGLGPVRKLKQYVSVAGLIQGAPAGKVFAP